MASKSTKAKADEKARAKEAKAAEKAAKKEQAKGKRVWKLMNAGTALAAGVVTAKALDATWKTATGHKPPNKPEHPDIGGREALAVGGTQRHGRRCGEDVREPAGRHLLGQVNRPAPTGHAQGRLPGDREEAAEAAAGSVCQGVTSRRHRRQAAPITSGRAVHADQLAVLLGSQLAAVVDQETLRAGELVGLSRQHLDRQLLV